MKIIFKKTLSLLILSSFLLVIQSTQAQQKPFKFGFKLAPAISWLSPDSKYYESAGSDFSFAWGFTADITLMEHYYLATGFNVSYFSGKLSYPYLLTDDINSYEGVMEEKYNLRYIEVPLAMKMKTNELVKNYKFFGLIGINTGINIRAKSDQSFAHSSASFTEENVDIKENSTLFKASLLVGAGAEYVIDESVSLVLGINFNNGFTNVLKGNNTVYPEIDAKAVPYYFELNIGVIF